MAGIATRTDLPDEARRRVIVEQIDAARARDGPGTGWPPGVPRTRHPQC